MLLIQLNAAYFRIPRDPNHRDQSDRNPAAGTRKSGLCDLIALSVSKASCFFFASLAGSPDTEREILGIDGVIGVVRLNLLQRIVDLRK